MLGCTVKLSPGYHDMNDATMTWMTSRCPMQDKRLRVLTPLWRTKNPKQAMALLAGFPSRDIFVYVHGFNTPFGYGVRSVAVKGRALRKGLSVCLAWPSNPPGEGAGWLIKQVRFHCSILLLPGAVSPIASRFRVIFLSRRRGS